MEHTYSPKICFLVCAGKQSNLFLWKLWWRRFNRLMFQVNITTLTSLICLWIPSMPFIHKIKAKLLGHITNIILINLCSQFTHSQSSSFVTFNIFTNVNNTVLCLLCLFASDKNWCYMIQWQIDGIWFSKKLILYSSVTNWWYIIQWKFDKKFKY